MRTVSLLVAGLLAMPAAAQDPSKDRLAKSPRHQEWVVVKNGQRAVHCFVVFPKDKPKAAAVLIIHENKGLTDWVRSVADMMAEAGYIGIAPDLLSGHGPKGGKTSDFTSAVAATQALSKLSPDQVTGDLNAAADYALKLPACNGKLAVGGFCWGGGQTFRFATNRRDLKAAFVFYGSSPLAADAIARIQCPVYGFYGGNDVRVNASVPKSAELMKAAGKAYEPVTYDGASHGFMRLGDMPDASAVHRKARDAAWERWKNLLGKL